MKIKITCQGSEMMSVEKLEHFQDDLKFLSQENEKRIEESIVKYGFSFPIFIWNSKAGKKIIDGHQRVAVIKKMLSGGYELADNQLPVITIEAKNEKEAKEKVLLAASRYGRIDESGLHDFLMDGGISIEEMFSVTDLPDVFMGGSEIDIEKASGQEFDENLHTKNKCQECGYEW